MGKKDKHSVATEAIDHVEIKSSQKIPIKINISLNSKKGTFKIKDLQNKMKGTLISPYVSIESTVRKGMTRKKFDVLIDDCTGIGENDADNTLSIYPNPVKNILNVSFNSNSTSGIITVYDITGQVAFEKEFQNVYKKDLLDGSKSEYEKLLKNYFDISEEEKAAVFEMQNSEESIKEEELNTYLIYKFLLATREYTLFGYYTSELVGETVLSYDPVPGSWESCIPLEDVGNSWSL